MGAFRLVLVPALVTLAVTAVRFVGEVNGWPAPWFSSASGNSAAVVGIVWLVPLFGAWFGARLARAGRGPASAGRAFLLQLVALVVYVGGFLVVVPRLPFDTATRSGLEGQILSMGGVAVLAVVPALAAWPALCGVNLLYGLLARLPVAALTWYALHHALGTHYEKFGPRDYQAFAPGEAAAWLGFLQLVSWTSFTAVFGGLIGVIAAVVVGGRRSAVSRRSAA